MKEALTENLLPQLEDLVAQRFHGYVNGSDAFRVEYVDSSTRPVFRSAAQLVDLIKDFCVLVHNIPINQQEFISVIEILLTKYFEKCQARFRSLSFVYPCY